LSSIDLETPVKGQSRSLKVVPFDRVVMVFCLYSVVTLSLRHIRLQKSCDLENRVMDPWRWRIRKCHHSIERLWLPIDVLW